MQLERLLQILIVTFVSLSMLLVGMGRTSLDMTVLAMMASLLSVWLCDVRGILALNRRVAGVIAFMATMTALYRFVKYGGGMPFLSIADLLMFMQVVLLYQKKDMRIYWQIVSLTLLLSVIGSAMNQGVWFAMLLVLFMVVGIAVLLFLFFYGQWLRSRTGQSQGRQEKGQERAGTFCRNGPKTPFDLTARSIETQPMPVDDMFRALTGELMARMGFMVVGTLALTAILFLYVPRVRSQAWQGFGIAPRRMMGFNDRVMLGSLGSLKRSPEKIMRLRLTESGKDNATDPEPYEVDGGIYLRGCVLNHYKDSFWSHPRLGDKPANVGPLLASRPRVLQAITIEPTDRRELFAVWNFRSDKDEPSSPDADTFINGIRFDSQRRRLIRPSSMIRRRMSYRLITDGFNGGQQDAFRPRTMFEFEDVEAATEPTGLPRVRQTANRWLAESKLPKNKHLAIANYFVQKLRAPGDFSYSLEGLQRDSTIDAIEDFLTKNRQGHCEYFASALVLLLREMDIPAHLVIGYHTNEYNHAGDYFQIRQLHAHAWVEAFLPPHQLPRTLRGKPGWELGGWIRLEPTPEENALEQIGMFERFWEDYVVDMDRQRQQDSIYGPLLNSIGELYRRITDPAWWGSIWTSLLEWLRVAQWGPLARAMGMFVVGLIVASVLWLASLLGRRIARGVSRFFRQFAGEETTRGVPTMPFYRTLESILARWGLIRRDGETQRELARRASDLMTASSQNEEVTAMPILVADAYYQVRFGGLPLDKDQDDRVEMALARLTEIEITGAIK